MCGLLVRSEIDKLEDSPFKAAFIEWSRLSSLLSKYYSGTYLGAVNPDTGRYVAQGPRCWLKVAS